MIDDNNINNDKRVDELFSALPQEMEPPAEIWNRIEAELDRKERANSSTTIKVNFFSNLKKGYRYVGAVAAIFVVTFLLNLLIFNYQSRQKSANEPGYQYSQALKELDETAEEYNRTKERLLTLVEKNEELFTAETVNSIKANVALMDAALTEIKVALEQDPANGEILAKLASMYYEETLMLARTGELLESSTN